SHLLQDIVLALWSDPATEACLRRAAEAYTSRRDGLLRALATHRVAARGRSGLNVWIPVPEEAPVVAALAHEGWAGGAGERYGPRSGPAVRVTIAALAAAEVERVALVVARSLRPDSRRASA